MTQGWAGLQEQLPGWPPSSPCPPSLGNVTLPPEGYRGGSPRAGTLTAVSDWLKPSTSEAFPLEHRGGKSMVPSQQTRLCILAPALSDHEILYPTMYPNTSLLLCTRGWGVGWGTTQACTPTQASSSSSVKWGQVITLNSPVYKWGLSKTACGKGL